MAERDVAEILRLAQEAHNAAERAMSAVSTHEELCAERYDNIRNQLSGIIVINQSVQDIRVRQAEQVSLHKALLIASVVIGLIYTLTQLAAR